MAKCRRETRTSSEIPFVPEVFCASYNEPMPIDPPNTSYLTAMPEAHAKPSTSASEEEQQNGSRWKPLIGTPSKPPVPTNILVPDPSPAQDVANGESPDTVAPSTPGSFIHRRRQGEYVPRPPVWKIYNLQTDASSSPIGMEDTDTESFDSDEEVFTDSNTHYISNLGPAAIPIAEQIRKMAEIFSETPGIVNIVEHKDLTVDNGTLNNACLRFLAAGTDSPVAPFPAPRLLEHNTAAHFTHPNLLERGTDFLETASSDTILRSGSTGSNEGGSSQSDSLKTKCKNNRKANQEYRMTSYETDPGPWEDEFSVINSVPRKRKLSLYSAFARIKPIKSYHEIQPKKTCKPIMSGCLVAYIKDIIYPPGQLGERLEPDNKAEFMVANIYDDVWALLIPRDTGSNLVCLSKAEPKVLGTGCPIPMVEIMYDEALFRFLPICSITAVDEFQSYKEATFLRQEIQEFYQRGEIRPPIRAHSMAAETEAKAKGVIAIPEEVYKDFNHRCVKPRSSLRFPPGLSIFRQSLEESSRKNLSAQKIPVEPTNIEIRQRQGGRRETRIQKKYGWNPLFSGLRKIAPPQMAQAKGKSANTRPAHDWKRQDPMTWEDYQSSEKSTVARFRLTRKGNGSKEEQQCVSKKAEKTQNEALFRGIQERKDTNRLMLDLSFLGHSRSHSERPSFEVAQAPSIQYRWNKGTACAPPNAILTTNTDVIAVGQQDARHIIHPEDIQSRKGKGHPEKFKENIPLPFRSIGNSIGKSLRGMRSKMHLPSRGVSPGPVSMPMAPRKKSVGHPTAVDTSDEDGEEDSVEV